MKHLIFAFAAMLLLSSCFKREWTCKCDCTINTGQTHTLSFRFGTEQVTYRAAQRACDSEATQACLGGQASCEVDMD